MACGAGSRPRRPPAPRPARASPGRRAAWEGGEQHPARRSDSPSADSASSATRSRVQVRARAAWRRSASGTSGSPEPREMRRVAHPDPVAARPAPVERLDARARSPRRRPRARTAHQLEAGLEELARLAGPRSTCAVRVREVAEPDRRSHVAEAVGDQARGRDRPVGAQHEDVPRSRRRAGSRPPRPARRPGAGPPRTRARGLDLPVAGALELRAQAIGIARSSRASSGRTSRVPGVGWIIATPLRSTGAQSGRRRPARGPPPCVTRSQARSAATRSMRAPSARSRSSIRS